MGVPLYHRVREIIESARAGAARSVNTAQVVSNWLIGREIVEEEQRGNRRAEYGARLLQDLGVRLTQEYGRGYSAPNLRYFRQFFIAYSGLLDASQICHALRDKSGKGSRVGHGFRYKLHLPSEAELRAELRREVRAMGGLPQGGDER